MIVRAWRATRFAIKALRFHWRHGDGACLKVRTEPPVGLATGTDEVSTKNVEIAYVPSPELMPGVPLARTPPRPQPAVSSSSVPFLVTSDGEVCYEGNKGADARRCIEALRATGVEWRSERDGESWDWGPR